jgi:transketolase
MNEGTIWEAALTAQAFGLDNLVVIVDRNHFQANIRTEELIPLEDIEAKFQAFNWATTRIDGHDFQDLKKGFATLPIAKGKPTAIIADTMRGKGLPSIQERSDRWFVNFTHDEVEQLLKELHGEAQATLTSETLTVR